MKRTVLLRAGVLALLTILLIGSATCGASECRPTSTVAAGRSPAPASKPDSGNRSANDDNSLSGLLGGITIPSATADVFNGIYYRHRVEINRILVENPGMVWDILDVLLDGLPALRAVPANGGRLLVPRASYDRAAVVLEKFAALSSNGLADDLRGAREMMDHRVQELDAGRIAIDLN